MNCPFCGNVETKVLDKRVSDPKANRRRRECQKCHKRFTTYEKVDKLITKIRKRDGTEVDFDPDKITNAIWKAAQSVGGTDKEMARDSGPLNRTIAIPLFPTAVAMATMVSFVVSSLIMGCCV